MSTKYRKFVAELEAMDKYDNLGQVGEGSYGMVLKCRHKESGHLVAIKKFLENEDDKMVKKIAMREIKMLKQLRHENLVNLIEVFRKKKRLYLVFEFVDHTVLDELEKYPNGLVEDTVRRVLWQVVRGVEFCHMHNIIHRDIKPENILVSRSGIVKLCDFGFARTLAQPGETYTDYVATRWYRAPELLVGDTKYGRAIDLWAVGCLLAEMLTGEPLFPGDSDIDQLYHIIKCFGNLPPRHREIFHKNPLFVGMRLPEVREVEPLEKKFPLVSSLATSVMKACLQLEAGDRPTCTELLRHTFFQKDGFAHKIAADLRSKIHKEAANNPLFKAHHADKCNTQHADTNGKGSGEKKKDKLKKKLEKKVLDDKVKNKEHNIEKVVPKPIPATNEQTDANNLNVSESGGQSTALIPPIGTSSSRSSPEKTEKTHKKPTYSLGRAQPASTSHNQSQDDALPPPDKAFNIRAKKVETTKHGPMFPELKAAEANPRNAKNKKLVPHITNLDPFNMNQDNLPHM